MDAGRINRVCETVGVSKPAIVLGFFQPPARPDVGLSSAGSVSTGKSATPLYSYAAANPRRRPLTDPLPVGQYLLSGRKTPPKVKLKPPNGHETDCEVKCLSLFLEIIVSEHLGEKQL